MIIEPRAVQDFAPDAAERERHGTGTNPSSRSLLLLQAVFSVMFLQVIVLIFVSFGKQTGPQFVVPFHFFAVDYNAFYVAAHNWMHGLDPYLHWRFVTPPFSLCVGLLLARFPFSIAGTVFLVLNAGLVLGSVVGFAKSVGLRGQAVVLVAFVTLLYYPFYLVVERGNLDGIVLATLLFAYRARKPVAAAGLLAFGIATKLYSALLLLVLARKRVWSVLTLTIAFVLLCEAPLLQYVPSWVAAVNRRSNFLRLNDNVSPAAVFAYAGFPGWKMIFYGFWIVTLAFVLFHDRESDWRRSVTRYIPWMISIPQLVYVYCGVLLLAVFVRLVADVENRPLSRSDGLMLAGFLLTTLQAGAFATFFRNPVWLWQMIYLAAPVGATLVILATVLSTAEQSRCR